MRQIVEYKSVIEASAEDVYSWHWQPGTLERLIPPWESVEVVKPASKAEEGQTADLKIGLGPLKLDWIARHCEFEQGKQFADVQQSGPFAFWHHVHRLDPITPTRCTLTDRIEYELPISALSEPALGNFVKEKLRRMFTYRHEVTIADLKTYKEMRGRCMKVLLTGSHGLVGGHLAAFLTSQGHQVVNLVRTHPQEGEIAWDPSQRKIDRAQLEGFDVVVHLAGENIASGRWTKAKKEQIGKSRIDGTRFLCETLASLEKPPEVFISASAIGYYGDRGSTVLTEASSTGSGFLAEVCREWEAATLAAQQKGIRVAMLRFGVILSPKGGALKQMLPPFQMGAGGRLGSGKQYMSWVSLEDIDGIVHHVITHRELQGPINAVSPKAVTNSEFTAALGAALKRPTIFPVPAFAANLLLGEMANELLLSSALVKPAKLIASDYSFRNSEIGPLLKQFFSAN